MSRSAGWAPRVHTVDPCNTVAQRHYARLLEIAAAADTPRPELAEARRYLGGG